MTKMWAMVLAPCIAQGANQSWKWPFEVINELKIKVADIQYILKTKVRLLFRKKECKAEYDINVSLRKTQK